MKPCDSSGRVSSLEGTFIVSVISTSYTPSNVATVAYRFNGGFSRFDEG